MGALAGIIIVFILICFISRAVYSGVTARTRTHASIGMFQQQQILQRRIIGGLFFLVCAFTVKAEMVSDSLAYETVKIGKQIWMAKNLNVKTEESWCYKNIESNCLKNGRLYSWNAAKIACPKGWHLPSKKEWEKLFAAVGGQSTAGLVLRSQTGWYGGLNGTDAFGFSALPAGVRGPTGGFSNDGYATYFWSATKYGENSAYNVGLYYSSENAKLEHSSGNFDFAVRCVKD